MLPHLFYLLVLHSFYTDLAERERGVGTLKSGRGREGERCRKSFDLQNCNSTLVQSQTGERESERERGIERVCVCVCA